MKARSFQLVAPSSQPPASSVTKAEAAFAQAVVELFAQAADTLGIPKSVTAIYAVIFASPRPLSFADVEERLQLSKGSVSQGLRVLRDFGAIKLADVNEPSGVSNVQSGKSKAQSVVSIEPSGKREGQGGVSEEQSGKSKGHSVSPLPLGALRLAGGTAASPIALRPSPLARVAPGRDHYIPDMQLRQLVARLLKERIEPQLAGSSRRLNSLVETVPFADPAAAELVRGRLKHLQVWQRKARKLVPFAKTLLALGQP